MRSPFQNWMRTALALLPLTVLSLAGCSAMMSGLSSTPAPELAGTRWKVMEIDGQPPVGTSDLTAQFSGDGRVSGNSGCNQYSGVYIQTGDDVRFGELLSTRRACVDDARQKQETRMLDILEGQTTMRQERRELRVRGTDGVLLLTPAT